jgi:hypothetical protein
VNGLLASASIKTHFVALKKVLDHAQRTGVIATTPLLRKVKKAGNARSPSSRSVCLTQRH